MEQGAIYAETRRRIGELARSLSPAELTVKLPTCPEWTSRDVVAHMAGLVVDIQVGRTEGAGTPAWTAAQVDAYQGRTLEELLAAWAAAAIPAEADFPAALGAMAARLVSDAYAHEQDIRGATNRPGHRDAVAVPVSLDVQLAALDQRLADAGLPALVLRSEDGGEWTVGQGVPGATVTVPSAWELLRAVQARRSRAQVAAFTWSGDGAERYLDAFFRWAPPDGDIVE